ncbi:metal ABC transporter solute-binding protein, Zn/Mn family [Sediminibacillus massiliensis]|uniref:metal ABC transporter solute-binding protein, Zn/Mn family n=1 Tax=Sediminibacillus massiliensis TaxID=1926277 RepID=UPI0009884D3D|nr:zinc ABC transporter substrate-binding protein [Sediminibacillus massiliensis]
MKGILYGFLLFGVLFFLAGCSENAGQPNDDDSNYTIKTTIYPIQYIVERLGGNAINAQTIYPPGSDAHSYEPTSKEITEIANSDTFIYLGEELETFASTTADALKSENVQLIELAGHEELFDQSTDNKSGHDHSHANHSHSDHDPHIWLDPMRMLTMAEIISGELTNLAPELEQSIETNLSELKDDLQALDKEFKTKVASKQHKEILVSHAAYGYWEQRYGIEQIAINGISNSSEPSQQDLIRIIDQARELNMEYIIFEQNVSNNVSKEIQKELNATPLTIHNLAVLTETNIEEGHDYLSLMEENIEVLDKATH